MTNFFFRSYVRDSSLIHAKYRVLYPERDRVHNAAVHMVSSYHAEPFPGVSSGRFECS